jgi:hypothetical protein
VEKLAITYQNAWKTAEVKRSISFSLGGGNTAKPNILDATREEHKRVVNRFLKKLKRGSS